MWLHGGRFLNGVCLFIRCYHNTADPAFTITVYAKPGLDLSVNVKNEFEPSVTDLTEDNRVPWLKHVKSKAKDVLRELGAPDSVVNELVVYVRGSEGYWHSLDPFEVNKRSFGNPKLFQAHRTEDHPEFLLTYANGTWPGSCVWVRSRVPLWVVSRDLVGSVQ
eukprot:GHVU01119888.1.p1 GENE.GHVU01119888.1~~GHVU01119888.1.p1  ORF type:complete len:163 (-),score=10.73 GHVU01119888.1:178-666(-)